MERPAYLRPAQFTQIIEAIENISIAEATTIAETCGYILTEKSPSALLMAILERPSKYLAFRGILHDLEQLTGMFIEFDDGELDEGYTYLIDAESAAEIVSNEPTILLRSGGEGAMVSRTRIEKAFRDGCVIDYLEQNDRGR